MSHAIKQQSEIQRLSHTSATVTTPGETKVTQICTQSRRVRYVVGLGHFPSV